MSKPLSTFEFISSLRRLNIQISVDGDRMRCNAPKGALTPILKAQLSERKSEIVAFFQTTTTQSTPEIKPFDRKGKLPLSFAQQRLWFLNQLEGQSATYTVPQVMQLDGELNTTALKLALSEIVRRHESLRTTFQVVEDEPVQVILPAEPLSLEPVDLQHLSVSDRAEAVRRLANESASTPFDLAHDYPVRIQLIKQDEQAHVLLVTMHHIVSDGWSMGIFTQELSTLYRDFLAGNPSSLPPLNVQYADFAQWQRQYLTGRVLAKQLGYWQKQLNNAPDLLALPTDYVRPARQSYQGASIPFHLGVETSQQLAALSAKTGSTLFMTLMAAYATLLYRYSQSEDIVIGSPIANRTRQEIEPLIGFFANTLPLRVDLSGEPTFLSLLQRLKPVLLAAYEHQDLPFEKLVEELNPARNLSYHPLFQVMFVLRNSGPKSLDLPGIQLTSYSPQKTTSKFDLTLSVSETPHGLTGKWQYSSDLFLSETIQQLNNNFKALLSSIVNAPEQTISQLPILSTTEQQQIKSWNLTQVDYDLSECIHQRFEAQASRTPDKVAVVFEETQLTYRELNEKANQLAHYLIEQGIKSESLIGLCLHRSLDMMIAVFAVMKAGGAYVPIEPNQPRQRIVSILAEAQPALILTQAALAGQFPRKEVSSQKAALLCIDTQWSEVSPHLTNNPVCQTTVNNLAYVLYTSGSTGKPKGVMVEHRNLLNYIDAVQERLKLDKIQHFASVSTLSADLGNTVIFPALCGGSSAGCLHILSEERVRDPNALATYFETHPIDCLKVVPSHLEALLSAKHPASVIPKQRLVLGGEPCSHELVQKVQQLAPDCVIFNHYGPTEATVGAIAGQLPVKDLAHRPVPPLGSPLANVQIHILDQYQNSVPTGVPGEIYISGAGVARGYLNRPELTAEKFVELSLPSLSEHAQVRCYKTGDLGKYNPDGSIEFVGRADDQVKIRGFRIELGEVEAALRQHSTVESVAVLAQGGDATSQQLVAYVVPHQSNPKKARSIDIAALSQGLKKQLPDYMVPSTFVEIEHLPFTRNGKLDRQALPMPKLSDRAAQAPFVPPTTPTEEQLVEIWCDCLNLKQAHTQACEQIGIKDNFFELGGHSLLATQVVSRIRDRFAIELPLRTVFESPTVAELATAVEQTVAQQTKDHPFQTNGNGRAAAQIDVLAPVSREHPLPLSFAQQRLWFLDQLEGQSATYNVPTVLEIEGDLKIESLAAALSEIVRRHEILRTTFKVTEAQPVQVVTPPAPLLLPVVDLKALAESDRNAQLESHITQEAHAPFDLSQDHPIRATLVTLHAEHHVLLVTMHHIVSDGWSRGVLMREISTLYCDFCQGKRSSLPALPIQYADFASWQRQWLTGNTLNQQLSYWQKELADAPGLLDLPSDHIRPAIQTFNGSRVRFEIESELSQQLNSLSQQRSSTLFMTLLTAFSVLLHRYTHADDIVVGSPVANRTRRELEPLIGFFTNTLILRTRIGENSTFFDLLKQVRQTALDAYAHQDLPFEKLVEELNPERNLSYHPIFQVMFILQNAAVEPFDLPGITLTPLQKERTVAKFDLTLSLSKTATGMRGVFEYNSDLFEAETIQRLVQHFRQLLSEIVKSPTLPVSQLSLLSNSEKQRILAGWNDTQVCFAQKRLIHQQFEAQVAKSPEAIAVLDEQHSLTYRALNEQAQQLANYLQQRGVGPETLVGICVERSPKLVVGLLGVLKAGGAYVPLDPAYPQQRITDTLNDANVSLILTQQHLNHLLPQADTDLVHLDSDWSTIEQYANTPDQQSERLVTPDNLAYVIYTSGSTGKPKGVQITHSAVANFLSATAHKPGLSADDTLLAVTTIAFDISVLELFLPLVVGAKVVLATPDVATDAQQLAQLIDRAHATVMQATPATWQMLIADGWQGAAQLKMLCGGEALAKDLADQLLSKGRELWNLYGPTEATVWTAACQVTPGCAAVPVAGPLANTQLYVLDGQLNPVPIGVAGEVHIGGAGLARGYLNRPALTAEKFVADPFSGKAGSKLYKTGDLACFRADGSLTFLGRMDQQVKLRGFRIELGEVEAALSEHRTVQSCVAVVREDSPGDKRLVAYWVSAKSVEMTADSHVLRENLKHRLPLYMMPSVFVELETLPLTDNGKVNRKALPEPDVASQITEYVAPTTELEQQLTNLWKDLLNLNKNLNKIGIHDNFFALGGHSLLATQLLARIRTHFATSLSLQQLFESPTVAEIAIAIKKEGPKAPQTAIKTVDNDERIPLSSTQKRMWVLEQLENNSSNSDGKAYSIKRAMRLIGDLSIPTLEKSLSEIVRRHEVLRTTFEVLGKNPVQIVNPPSTVQLSVVDLRALCDTNAKTDLEDKLRTKVATAHNFDLQQGPLFRFELFKIAEDEHVFVSTIHHIVFDGWSYRLLFKEMSLLYKTYSKNLPSPLPDLSIQYADFTSWQQAWLQSEDYQTQLNYWKTHLADAPHVLELPTDYTRPSIQKFDGALYSQQLSKSATEELLAFSQEEKATLFMVMLSAFKLLCYRFTNQERITIGSPIAGRSQAELEQLMGFFVSNLVLHTDLSGEPSCRELLSRVKQTALDAYANQAVPFEALLEELQPPRDLSRTPLFQVWLNMVNLSDGALTLPELQSEPLKLKGKTSAKFDLALYVQESDQGLNIKWVYNTTLFQADTIEYMSRCFQSILEGMVADLDQSVSTLPLPVPQQSQQWETASPITLDYTPFNRSDIEQSIPARFAAQVQQHGERTAVKTPRYEWSYQALDHQSDRIAAGILAQQNEANVQQIALLFEHDAPMVAAMLGALKLGKTYVALDPGYPKERLQYILKDSQANVILASQQTLELANELAKAQADHASSGAISIVNTSTLSDQFERPVVSSTPDDLAYILYTSGSTGKPKGVMQNHRNVLHFIQVYTNSLHISEHDRLTLLSSYSFDAAVMDIFGALMNGATLYPIDIKQEGLGFLAQQLNDERITIYHSTPTLYRYFLESLPEPTDAAAPTFSDTRLVVMGGEAVNKHDVVLYKAHFPANAVFVNGLGPSESTVTLQQFIDQETSLHLNCVPVGYPVAETEVLLLNSQGQESQLYGEIAIRSRHVALGYWQRPELTKTAFIESTEDSQKRTYRTGDLGRLRPNGSLEFLGRKDFQIKLRGFRVEPGEIESVLGAYPQIQKAIVMEREDRPGDQRLIGYVVLQAGENEQAVESNQAVESKQNDTLSAALRQWCEQQLPDYMVPSAFVVLTRLPLTPSGKIDRLSLPAPVPLNRRTEADFAPPQSLTEQKLAQIWQEILALEEVGIHDNFFDLGGHSLLATQLFARIKTQFATNLSLRHLFELPTIAEIAIALGQESPQASQAAIQHIDNHQLIPLSSTQKRMWVLDQLEGNGSAYSIRRTMRLIGDLSVPVLEQCLSEIIRRHEILRTTFAIASTGPIQVVNPPVDVQLSVVDLRSLSETELEDELRKRVAAATAHRFTLQKGPLFHFELFRVAEDQHVFVTNIHHIVFDGWSYRLLFREMSLLYAAYSKDLESPLPELSVQYADFASWQQQWLQSEDYQTQLNYWKTHLEGAPYVLELPTDYPRPAVQKLDGELYSQRISLPFTEQLLAFSRREKATLYMVMLSAFKLLCYRFTNQERITIGSPIAGRSQAELEQLIGFFVSSLVLHTDLSGEPSCRELISRVKQTALDAYTNQAVPFEALLEELQPPRDLSRTPLFQVWFNMVNLSDSKLTLSELQIKPLRSRSKTLAKFDLTIYVRENAQGLSIQWVYNTTLFQASTIEYMSTCFQTILEEMVAHPEQLISTVPLPSPISTESQLLEIQKKQAELAKIEVEEIEQSIPARFAQQVKEHGQKIAVKTPRCEWTYTELDSRANQIAAGILEQCESAEQVAILFEHDAPMIATMLGTLKAGKAYVALDPGYPEDRLRCILQDSQASVILANEQTYSFAQALADGKVPVVNTDWLPAVADDFSGLFSGPNISPDARAYILYTSGSTGKPKGVVQIHRNVQHFIWQQTQLLNIQPNDRLSLVASYSFDAAIVDIFSALLSGATLYPIAVKMMSPEEIGQWIEDNQITIYHSTPTLYRTLLSHYAQKDSAQKDSAQKNSAQKNGAQKDDHKTSFSSIRAVVLGGEETRPSDICQYQSYFAEDCQFVNLYGSTESTIGLQYVVPQDLDARRRSLPIGYPIVSTEILLLNEVGQPTQGMGEIAVRSAYLALGYWQQPERTTAAFLPDPDGGNRRIYRTGDLGRRRADGTVEFLGRKDFQVKLRGFRIELGEVEAVLSGHPAIDKCVVVGRTEQPGKQPGKQAEGQPGELYLAAYFVVKDDAPDVDTESLRQFVSQQLPNYMVPAAFVSLTELPLTPSGKINRRALPTPETFRLGPEVAFVEPQTSTEKTLAEIWATVLQVDKVGLNDDFFMLGGHSLKATQAISRIQSELNIELSLRYLFEASTLAELAAIAEAKKRENGDQTAESYDLKITSVPRDQPLPLSFAQQRLWFLSQLEGENSAYVLTRSMLFSDDCDVALLKRAIAHIINRHEVLRTTIHTANNQPVQVIAPEVTSENDIELPIIDLRSLSLKKARAKVRRLTKQLSNQSFDLSQDALIRFRLVQLPNNTHRLLIAIHHVITDGWSMSILTQELLTAYEDLAGDFSQAQSSTLPPLSIQYADFAYWQRQWLQGDKLTRQIDYWQKQLANIPALLTLPTDHPRPAMQSFRGGRIGFTIDSALTQQLSSLTQQNNVTLFMTLLTAFSVLLHRYTSANDIVVGSPIANRTHKEIEPLIGFFANTLILRTQIDSHSTFSELLKTVRKTALDAYEHQDLPFERLVEALNPERNLSYHPIFQVMFILQNATTKASDQSSAHLKPRKIERTSSKFDLTLSMSETADGLQGTFEYNSDLFEAQTIQRLIEHFHNLLQAAVQSPTAPVSHLSLLSQAETRQQLSAWNNTEIEFEHKGLIHQQFEQQATVSPDAIAVICGQQSLTYRELNQRSQQLANYLQQQGVGPKKLVGLCIERSSLLLVGLLAVLKAGGTYVPIDPTYPKARIDAALTDANVSLVLTQFHLAEQLPPVEATSVYLDRDWDKIHQCSAEPTNSWCSATPDNLAYVIYTSGSTGKPKGVQITHSAVTNFLSATAHKPGLSADDTLLAVTTIAFDISVLELFLPLVVGAKVVLATTDVAADAQQLAQLIDRAHATVMQATPATWQMLIADSWQGSAQLKMLCGGEALAKDLADQLLTKGRELWNLYGPTEATVWTAACQITPSDETVPVAGPLANTQLYVLDERLHPVPIGVAGEVHIGGAGLARGYLNRPALTAEKFVADPFSGKAGSKLYKTGDLACFRADGSLAFLGRIDQQVKLRGFRIELGEVEAALSEHRAVQSCVAVVREDSPGDKRLVAYWVPPASSSNLEGDSNNGSKLDSLQLRQHLKQLLPLYMMPSILVELEALPLTNNGKVNRQALPVPDMTLQTTDYAAPTTAMEQQLVKIWQEVLAVEKIGIRDNFFELGGHSLLAVQLMNKIQQVLTVKMQLSMLFQASTVAQLAEVLMAKNSLTEASSARLETEAKTKSKTESQPEAATDEMPLVLIRRSNAQRPPFFWIHPIGGSVFCYSALVSKIKTDCSFYGLQARGLIQQPLPEQIEIMATDYIDQIRQVQPEGPYRLGGWSMGGVIAFEMAQQLIANGEPVDKLVMIDSSVPGRPHLSSSEKQPSEKQPSKKQPSEKQYLLSFVRNFDCSPKQFKNVRHELEAICTKTSDSPMALLLETLQSNNVVSSVMTASELAVLFTLFKHHQRILSAYQPQHYPGSLQLFECQQPRINRRASLLSDWQPLVKGEIAFSSVPGNHYSIMRAPHVGYLAASLTQILGHPD